MCVKMGSNQNDFVLDSKGRCFICLDKFSTFKYEQGSEPPPVPKYSLHYLSRYLKMDLRKVFKDTEQIPPQLLSKVENSRLKVELCDGCVQLTEQFSENYRKLEKAEMELGSFLRLIHAKFLNVSEAGKTKEFKKLTNMEPQLQISCDGELEILEVLREEAFQKSHDKLRAGVPRVNFRNLTRKEIMAEKFKPKIDNVNKQKSPVLATFTLTGDSSKSDLNASHHKIKLETQDALEDDALEDDDNDALDHHHNSPDEAMCKDVENMKGNHDMNSTGPGFSVLPGLYAKIHRKQTAHLGDEKRVCSINPETGKYKCQTCSVEYSDKHGVERHYESVHLKVRFKCVTCGKQFSRRDTFDRHQKSAHIGIRYACQVCSKSFTCSGNLRQHQRKTKCGKKLV